MGRYGRLSLTALAFLLTVTGPVLAQNVVDSSNCEDHGVHCPKDGEPSYKKYCCLESNGGLTLYSCCNPYFGLIIGISVGIPVIILIIVAVVVAYCVCHHYHNRKMRSLMATYHRRRREEDHRREVQLLAPPPYSVLEEDGEETEHNGLPAYSENDPYNTAGSTSTDQQRRQSGANEEGSPPPGSETATSVVVEESSREQGGEEGAEGELLSTDQSSCDRAPLLDEGVGEH